MDNIIEKIKKLLALSKSDNQHEAALALQKAFQLMKAHNITDYDIAMSEVKEAKSQPINGIRVNIIKHKLASLIARLFSCELYYSGLYNGDARKKTIVNFVGIDANAEIASYCFDLLERKMNKDRAEYMKTIPKRTKPYNKAKRAHAFCMGWLIPIAEKVVHLVPVLDVDSKIVTYMQAKELMTRQAKKVNTGKKTTAQDAMADGYNAGSKVNVNAGVSSTRAKQLL